jgi:CheY-like chemotaxis protein
VAEDDENQAELLQLVWSEARICNKLHIVRDGEDVVAYLKGEADYGDRGRFPLPAMLILDLQMQKMGGMEVLEWLYPQPEPDFPCVILTAGRSLTFVVQAARRGAHSFLFKPLETEKFQSFMHKFKGIEIEGVNGAACSVFDDVSGQNSINPRS